MSGQRFSEGALAASPEGEAAEETAAVASPEGEATEEQNEVKGRRRDPQRRMSN